MLWFPRSPILFSAMQPTESDPLRIYNVNVALSLNLVLLWEYRLGFTVSFVVTHSQQGLPPPDGELPPVTLLPRGLLSGPATDAVLLKWSYFWSL